MNYNTPQQSQGMDLGRIDIIRRWHDRAQKFGLCESDEPDFSLTSLQTVSQSIDENKLLFRHAQPVMDGLYQHIATTHSMVLLTNASGLILHSLGDNDFLAKADRIALRPGSNWSEETKGTNAIGTALVEGVPTLVHADEHYLRANHFLTCSCAPIYDPSGSVVGALDVTGDKGSFHEHTMALVRLSAQVIENSLFADLCAESVRIRFHPIAERLGTLDEGIIKVNAAGLIIGANRNASVLLGLSNSALRAQTLSALLGLTVPGLHDHYRKANPALLQIHPARGQRMFARAEFFSPTRWFGSMFATGAGNAGPMNESTHAATHAKDVSDATTVPVRPAPAPAATGYAPRPALERVTLQQLNTGDAKVASTLDKLSRIRLRDIPVLILGETGTGKELLAQAIHNDSPRRDQPFVAINCASIPETLIESELFGYEEGAFTGARRRGRPGKIVQAHRGTLFLDEIGDMPLSLQSRLLRVLQDRSVTPLGGGDASPVDILVVCATHRNLREMIGRGEFREDLYYRLNGLVVKLPPVRERTDLEVVIERILNLESERCGMPLHIEPEILDLMKVYPWPGNFRQLSNLLRHAVALVDDDGLIRRDHLPDDFLEDLDNLVAAGTRDAQTTVAAAPAGSPVDTAVQGRTASHELAGVARRPMVGAGDVDPAPVTLPQGVATPEGPVGSARGRSYWDEMEVQAIRQALEKYNGNVSAAAKALGISRNTIYRRLPPAAQRPSR